jgi:hypothetical protein
MDAAKKKVFKYIIKNGHLLFNMLLNREIGKREYIILEDYKLIYLNLPKTGCSSVKKSLLDKLKNEEVHLQNELDIHSLFGNMSHFGKLPAKYKDYYMFTFVRNPFTRVVSGYLNKFRDFERIKKHGFLYQGYMGDIFTLDMEFDEYVRNMVKIPHAFAEKHFRPLYHSVSVNATKPVDYIGKFQTMAEDFKFIQEKFELPPLPHLNKSNSYDYRTYYTPELVELVYQYYKQDIEQFDYQQDYEELKAFVEQQH